MVKCTIYHTQLEMFSFFKNTDVSNKNERKRKTKKNTQDDSDKSSMSCIKELETIPDHYSGKVYF